MQKLINAIQNYAWGSHATLTELYDIVNPDNLLTTELWMGTHSKSNLQILAANGRPCSLHEVINADKTALFGDKVVACFDELPFLSKVLRATQSLSIQVHPNERASEGGFARESAIDIPLSAAERNYRNSNHRSELVSALTPLLAMNAFREFNEIVTLLQLVASAHPAIGTSLQQSDTTRLSQLSVNLLNMQGKKKAKVLQVLCNVLARERGEPWQTTRLIAEFYPNDSSFFSPPLLNMVKLNPGETAFLFAETPHAYLQGVALEVVVNLDNVLRIGPTPKYIDIPGPVANVEFEAKPAGELLTQPQQHSTELNFPILVEDFAFPLYDLSAEVSDLAQASAAIILCVDGEAVLHRGDQNLTLKLGESAFVAANELPVQASGRGRVAHVSDKLQ